MKPTQTIRAAVVLVAATAAVPTRAQVGSEIQLGRSYDPVSGQVLAFEGSPGTASVRAEPFAPRRTSASCGVAGRHLVLSDDGAVELVTLGVGRSIQNTPLPVPASPDSMVLSWDGSAAALYYTSAGSIHLLTNLGGAGDVQVRILAAGIPIESTLLAVRDDAGQILAAASGNPETTLWLLAPAAQPVLVWRARGPLIAMFGPVGSGAVAASQSEARLVGIDSATLSVQDITIPGNGEVRPVAIAREAGRFFLADPANSAVHELNLASGEIRSFASFAPPSRLSPVGIGLFLLTEPASGAFALLDLSRELPRVVTATPAGGEQ